MLCGTQSSFQWLPTDRTHFDVDLYGKHAVIGGHQDDGTEFPGVIHIGRKLIEGRYRIGKITAKPDLYLYYVSDNLESVYSSSFDILLSTPN